MEPSILLLSESYERREYGQNDVHTYVMCDMFDVYDNDDFNSAVEDVQCGIIRTVFISGGLPWQH